MEPINKRPVMDIQRSRPQPVPLPRTNYVAPAVVEPAPVQEATPQPQQPTPPKLPKTKAPIGAIIMAILVGGALIAVAVFGYMKSQDKKVANTPATTTEVKATSSDVNSTLDDTDAQLKQFDDATDYNASGLSDDSLGL